MKRIYTLGLLGLCLLFVASGVVLTGTSAQTGGTPRLTGSTPTPSATPKAAPTINDEDIIVKVDTELVNLNVRVVDRNNRPISGLNQSDFKIFEDDAPQKIEFFSQSQVPTN